jgi:hypothetical protein
MAIKWDDYIEPLVRHFYSHLDIIDGHVLKTAPIKNQNRFNSITTDLPAIDWADDGVIYRTETSFLIKLSIKGEKFYALLTNSNESRIVVNELAEELQLKAPQYDDAFFLFCVKSMNLQPRRDFDTTTLRASLKCNADKKIYQIDFDETRRSFGEFYVWKITSIVPCERDLLRYVLLVDGNDSFTITNTFQNRVNLEAAATQKCVDFARIAELATRSIFEVIELPLPNVNVSIKKLATLLPALEDLRIIKEEVIFRPGGGVFFRFIRDEKPHLGISISSIIDSTELIDYLETLSIFSVDYNEAEFLSIAYQLSGSLPILSKYFFTTEASRLILEKFEITDSLHSIDIDGMKDFFDEIFIFDLTNSSLPGIWAILLKLTSNFRALSSPYISNDLRGLAKTLSDTQGVEAENVYLALTASHWKHSFLEAFRLIESLYYFGWMKKIKTSLNSTISEFKLAQYCKSDLSWKAKELPSIQNLFSLIPEDIINKEYLERIPSIREQLKEGNDQISLMRAFGGAVYSIRNSGVHQGEHETEKKIVVTSLCWAPLTEGLFKIILYFYSDQHHKNGMPQ